MAKNITKVCSIILFLVLSLIHMICELSIYDFNLGHLQSTKSLSNVNHKVLRMLEIRMASFISNPTLLLAN